MNGLEENVIVKNVEGLNLDHFKIESLIYADGTCIILFSETADGLQNGSQCMFQYYQTRKLPVTTQQTKLWMFRKDGILRRISERMSVK